MSVLSANKLISRLISLRFEVDCAATRSAISAGHTDRRLISMAIIRPIIQQARRLWTAICTRIISKSTVCNTYKGFGQSVAQTGHRVDDYKGLETTVCLSYKGIKERCLVVELLLRSFGTCGRGVNKYVNIAIITT